MKVIYENREYNEDEFLTFSTPKNLNFYAHWHPEIEIMYVLEGSIKVTLNSNEKDMCKDEMSICASNDIHYYSSEHMRSSALLIIFKTDVISPQFSWSRIVAPSSAFIDCGHLKYSEDSIISIMKSIKAENEKKDEFYKDSIKMHLNNLLLVIYKNFPDYYRQSKDSIEHISTKNSPIKKTIQYIESNFSSAISLQSIAKHAGLSEFYFSREFKQTTGMNFHYYLSYVRIQNAKKMIRYTDKNIIDIANECGYTSIRTFNRNFKQFCGTTPSQYRMR